MQKWSAFILFLFLFPILLNFLPNNNGTSASTKVVKEPLKIVYAANVLESEMPEEKEKKKALLYFTHNHEAFEPVTKAHNGKVAVSHRTENITKFGEKLKEQMNVHGLEASLLEVDNMAEINKNNQNFGKAYHTIRPFVEREIKENPYDLVVDVHRDSIGRKHTTIEHEGEKYAKVAFVVGLEHPNFKHNEQIAEQIKAEMERIVPGITRAMIKKGGPRVDGKYNQDLHPSLVLLELGGVGNTEDELNRTVNVVGKAMSAVILNKNDD